MTNEEKRAVARVIAKKQTNNISERKFIYIDALYELGLKTNCCEEGICGGSPSDTRLYR